MSKRRPSPDPCVNATSLAAPSPSTTEPRAAAGRRRRDPGRDRGVATTASSAYHEAGHVVAALLFGLPTPDEVALSDDGGACHWEDASELDAIMEARPREGLRMLLAGAIAGRLAASRGLCPAPDGERLVWDVLQSDELLGDECAGTADAERFPVEAALEKLWKAVAAIARALLKRGKLSGDECEELFYRAARLSKGAREYAGRELLWQWRSQGRAEGRLAKTMRKRIRARAKRLGVVLPPRRARGVIARS